MCTLYFSKYFFVAKENEKYIQVHVSIIVTEEDELKKQAKNLEEMKNMMEVLSSEHIKGEDKRECIDKFYPI